MPEFTLRLRRYDPETGQPPYWAEYTVDLEAHRSVLEGILQAKAENDGSIGIRCSCRAAICGSCGVMINGRAAWPATRTSTRPRSGRDGVIEVEPINNMPVIKDLVIDMEAVHWKKLQRVTPWLINKEPIPEREYIVPHENMVDVTQSMACIQCGACVASCLSMEVDPLFVGPAALAKAYRFVGDPRDAAHYERLKDLAEDPHGMYDCTHCFNCIEACPKGVAPMNQIMRLRRVSGTTTTSSTATTATATRRRSSTLVKGYGLLHEAELLPRSYGGDSWFGKFAPAAGLELLDSLPVDHQGARAPQGHPEGRAARPQDPQGRPQGRPADLRDGRGQGRARRAEPVHLGLRRGRGRRRCRRRASWPRPAPATAPAPPPSRARPARNRGLPHPMKVAYWPGCVSRGFTPELHGSMAKVAPLLDIELVELDRANCCGAGVIAEHSQELADTLNARTFALAQQTDAMMMNICSTCQGSQTECQERLDANAEYREHINGNLEGGLRYDKGKVVNKNLLWLLVEDIGLDKLRCRWSSAR